LGVPFLLLGVNEKRVGGEGWIRELNSSRRGGGERANGRSICASTKKVRRNNFWGGGW